MHYYQLVPPAAQKQEGDEHDDKIVWVRTARDEFTRLSRVAFWTGSQLTEIQLRDGEDGVDFSFPEQRVELLHRLSSPGSQGRESPPTKIAVISEGGVVRSVLSDTHRIEVEVLDADELTGEEAEEYQERWDKAEKDCPYAVY